MFKDYPQISREIEDYRENLRKNRLCIYHKAKAPKDLPDRAGLYLMAQIAADPIHPTELVYCIKIGKSKNIRKRIQSYSTMAPLNACLYAYGTFGMDIDKEEKKWHERMEQFFPRTNGDKNEWFFLPAADYYGFIKNGFNTRLPDDWKYDEYIEKIKKEMP